MYSFGDRLENLQGCECQILESGGHCAWGLGANNISAALNDDQKAESNIDLNFITILSVGQDVHVLGN